jgi:hypothetical protein
MLSHVRRTITLSDDEGAGRVPTSTDAGSVKVGRYPDTLEVIHRPDVEPPVDFTERIVRSAPDELEDLLSQFRAERRRRRSVRAAKGLVGLLAVGLLTVWLLDPTTSGGDENRAEVAFPNLTASGLVGGSNYRQTDAALRDRLALRRYVVEAIGQTARDRLGTSLNPAVVMGANSTPFTAEDFTLPCESDFEPARVDAGLRELRALGQATGKTIMVAIAPDKSSILTSDLGRRGSALMACSNRVRQATEATWGGRSTPPVLTIWKQLAAEDKAHPDKVFQHGDSHWTSQGALVWSRAVIAALIKQGEAPRSLRAAPKAVPAGVEPATSDLYRLMGITREETVPVWRVSRPDVDITSKRPPTPSGRGKPTYHAESASAPLIQGRTLVVHDSFFSRAEGQLAPYFSDLAVLHWADFLAYVKAGTLPHFDRIIIETVQRGWPERAGWLEPGQPVHDALAKELSRPSKTAAHP